MATLLKTMEQITDILSVNNFQFNTIKPYLKQASRRYIIPLIGDVLFENWIATAPTAGVAKKVFELLLEAEANLGYFRYTPLGSVQVTQQGIMVSENQNAKNADWWKVRDLKRSFLETGFEALDDALKLMEKNGNDFPEWKSSEGYTIFTELFVTNTDTFQRWFNINRSRRIFVALRPFLLESQHQYIMPFLGNETSESIKTADNNVLKQALELVQAAQVNYTISNAAGSGIILLNDSEITLKNTEIPQKTTKQDEAYLQKLIDKRTLAGTEYLKALKKLMTDNPEVFPVPETTTTIPSIKVHNTKSIVSF